MLLPRRKPRWRRSPLPALLLLPLLFAVRGRAQDDALPQVRYPENDAGIAGFEAWKKAQAESAARLKVFHDFKFSDGLKQSGITFEHRAVDDVRKNYRPVHYDHGTGIAFAKLGDSRGYFGRAIQSLVIEPRDQSG